MKSSEASDVIRIERINDSRKDDISDVMFINDDMMIRCVRKYHADYIIDDREYNGYIVSEVKDTAAYDEAKYFVSMNISDDEIKDYELTTEKVDELISYLTRIRTSITK